ncbi:MAG TPA: nitroreductase family protein [Syntrophales bacterium]|nr:nitroreductase family protein [Syntrophales bacterium]
MPNPPEGMTLLTTKEAIEKRRSIRKFKPDPIPGEYIRELLESARLAPSGCNAQPWRFKVVTEPAVRRQLAEAAHGQGFIADAPAIIICCADIRGYLDGTVSGIQDLGRIGAVEGRIVEILVDRARQMKATCMVEEIGPRIAANVVIAIEHMALRALDFGLGTCWIRLVDEQAVKKIFRWDENIIVVALLPVGYPAESPAARKRLPMEELML